MARGTIHQGTCDASNVDELNHSPAQCTMALYDRIARNIMCLLLEFHVELRHIL